MRNEVILDAMVQLARDTDKQETPDMRVYSARFERLKSLLRYDAVPALSGQKVRLAGYIVPLDSVGRGVSSDFLLVPYFGACLHLPAPNPNQIVRVRSVRPQAIGRLEQAFWIEGTLSTQRFQSDLATTAYSMQLSGLSLYRGKTNPYSGPVPHANGD